jgi:hypothetical protein
MKGSNGISDLGIRQPKPNGFNGKAAAKSVRNCESDWPSHCLGERKAI